MIQTQTLCTIVSTLTKQHLNVETLQILDFRCRYLLPFRKLVTLSSLLTTHNFRIGFIFDFDNLFMLFAPLMSDTYFDVAFLLSLNSTQNLDNALTEIKAENVLD